MDRVDLVRVAGDGAGGDEEGRDVRHDRVEAEHCGVFLSSPRLLGEVVRCGLLMRSPRECRTGRIDLTLDRVSIVDGDLLDANLQFGVFWLGDVEARWDTRHTTNNASVDDSSAGKGENRRKALRGNLLHFDPSKGARVSFRELNLILSPYLHPRRHPIPSRPAPQYLQRPILSHYHAIAAWT